MSLVGDGGGEEDLCHVRSGGRSLTYVASGGWGRRRGSVSCTQWGMLSDTCPQWGMGEERRISGMYAVGDAQRHTQWGTCTWGSEKRMLPCTQWGMTHGEEKRSSGICVMYAVGDAQ